MPVKSIIDVDINGRDFEKFWELFKTYKDALNAMPEQWKDVNKEAEEIIDTINVINSGTEKVDEGLEAVNKTAGKINITLQTVKFNTSEIVAAIATQTSLLVKQLEVHSKVGLQIKENDKSMEKAVKTNKSALSSISDVAMTLMKWTGLSGAVSGILGGVGGYLSFQGLTSLARSASSTRVGAMELGVSPSAYQAANSAYGAIGGAGSVLSGLAGAKRNLAMRGPLINLGFTSDEIDRMDPSQMLPLALERAQAKYKGFAPGTQDIMSRALGLDQLGFSNTQLALLGNQSTGELQSINKRFAAGVGEVGANEESEKTWQRFLTDINLASDKMENVFINGLSKIAPDVSHLVAGFTYLADEFFNNPDVKKGIHEFGDWMHHLGDELKDPEFKKAMSQWTTNVVEVAEGLGLLVKAMAEVGIFLFKKVPGAVGDALRTPHTDDFGQAYPQSYHPDNSGGFGFQKAAFRVPSDRSRFGSLESQYGLPGGILNSVMMAESGGNPWEVSNKGAKGAFQFTDETAHDYNLSNPWDVNQSANAAGRYLQNLLHMFGGNVDQALAAYNSGPGTVQKAIRQYGVNWRKGLPNETQNYVPKVLSGMGSTMIQAGSSGGVNIRVINQTGGNVVGVSAGMAAGLTST
jgi:Transglycosylase SLT domain